MDAEATNPVPAGAATRKALARFVVEQLRAGRLDKPQAAAFLQELGATAAASAPAPAPAAPQAPARDDVAIIGMACRFPDADSTAAFWDNLRAGRDSIRPFPPRRRAQLAALDGGRTPLFDGGFLAAVDGFDAEYFGVPPRVARQMDPYQRLMLQVLVETLEDAGWARGALHGRAVGVYVGNDHTHRLFNSYVAFIDEVDSHAVTGSWTAVLASRLSYLFNLKGPAVVLDTACSSGLAALDAALKALRAGDCEAALVGAANLFFAPGKGLVGEIENEHHQVRAFDRRAAGTVWGEGVAAVLVKPLAAALRDGDPVHAVIRGIALNNDGASNGLTAPNPRAQQEVILKAWERAGIDARALDYVEAHGTGTALGDPIEIKGLIGAFERHGAPPQGCAIGSVKTNIGHTVGVAGLASLLKVVLALEHETLPPSLHFEDPSRHVDFCSSPVYVNDCARPWPRGAAPRLAGISSFSLSGTNCHLVVQEAPREAAAVPVSEPLAPAGETTGGRPEPAGGPLAGRTLPRLLPLSARSPALLRETVRRLRAFLAAHPAAALGAVALTLAVGREPHPAARAAVVADTLEAFDSRLERLAALLDAGAPGCDGDAPGADAGIWGRFAAPASQGGAAERQQRDAALEAARGGDARALAVLARLHVAGVPLPWARLYEGEALRRASLPPQPFDEQPFWDKAPGAPGEAAAPAPDAAGAGAEVPDVPDAATALATVRAAPSRLAALPPGEEELPWRVAAYFWTEVLGYPRVAADDGFHALGGDSISAMRLVHLLNAVFGLEAPVSALLGAESFGGFVRALLERHGLAEALRRAADGAAAPPGAGGEEADADAIRPLPPAPFHALSHAQQRMAVLARLNPGSTAYNVSAAVRLDEPVDAQRTEAVLRRVIERHEILRTGFHEIDGSLRQVVHAAVPFALERIALAPAADEAAETALAQEAVRGFVRPFDLARPPLLRVALLQAASGRSYLAVDMHHIVTDGSSMGVLVGEFVRLAAGQALPPLPFQFKDFAAWQNARLAGAAAARDAAFWRERFAGEVPALELPLDHPRPALHDGRGAKAHFLVPEPLAARLRALAREQGTTLYVLLLGAFMALLHKLGAGDDLVVGSPVAGRGRLALHGLIGMFVNTLALRAQVRPGDRFTDFLARLRADTLAALEHQDYPYEALVEALRLPRHGARNPLLDVCFSLQNEDIGLSGPGVQPLPLPGGGAKFDWTVMARDTGAGLALEWEYATALFEPASIARWAGCFERLLAQVAADPATPLAALSIVDPAELRWLRDEVNATATDYGAQLGIPALFDAQARARPGAVALRHGARSMTYAELREAADRLACVLAGQGVVPGDLVALLYRRGMPMVVAILAVLKAGAAYVPLDPEHPPERLALLLEEAAPRLLLAGEGTQPPAGGGVPLLRPSDIDLAAVPAAPPAVAVDGEMRAYVMFTSGSTGRPKGVQVRHKSVVRVVRHTNYLHLGPDDACLLVSNYAFDGSVPDLFGPLLNGGCAVLIDQAEVLDPDRLAQALQAHAVTSCFMTTALFNALVELRPQALRGLRTLMFGGEVASVRHVAQALAVMGPGRLLHCYGPTETTTFATVQPLARLEPGWGAALPIGRPIANTTVYVLDAAMQPVPPGVAGELWIGGDGVALGYLGRPELDAGRFVADPFVPGGRLYRSGDRVKWNADGLLVFLGRCDQQVKIRGFRIEPGEIEAVLALHPAVRACLVTAEPDAQGQRALRAWVVPAQAQAQSQAQPGLEAALRAHLSARLPAYMVPAAITLLDAMALNANGKLDRGALPAAVPAPQPAAAAGAARDAREAAVLALWAELLDVPAPGPGPQDNFFALGGDSIKAIQVVARLRAQGWHTEVQALFQCQTAAELAAQLSEAATEEPAPPPAAPAGAAAAPGVPAHHGIDAAEIDDILAGLDIT